MSIDIKSLLDENSVRVWTYGKNCSDGWINVRCPFCNDKSNHMGINLESGETHCWHCGETGNLTKLLMELFGIDFRAAKQMMAPYQGYSYTPTSKRQTVKSTAIAGKIIPKEAVKEMPPEHKEYLISRRFNPDIVHEKYDLYYCRYVGNFKGRIIAPIKINNEIVSFVGMSVHRSMVGDLKYKNCPDMKALISRRNLVYNLDHVYGNKLIIVEGILDCWRIGDNCVATLTTSFTQEQINLMANRADDFFIMFDSSIKDPLAYRKAKQLASQLASIGKHVEILKLDSGDPDDLTDEQALQLRQQIFI